MTGLPASAMTRSPPAIRLAQPSRPRPGKGMSENVAVEPSEGFALNMLLIAARGWREAC